MMMMYFHFGIADYILFKTWLPRTPAQYWLSLLAIFFFAFLIEALKAARSLAEQRWRTEFQKSNEMETQKLLGGDSSRIIPPFVLRVDFLRACFRALEIFSSYALMLAAMNFNVGVFGAIVAGTFAGSLTFGRFQFLLSGPSTTPQEECH